MCINLMIKQASQACAWTDVCIYACFILSDACLAAKGPFLTNIWTFIYRSFYWPKVLSIYSTYIHVCPVYVYEHPLNWTSTYILRRRIKITYSIFGSQLKSQELDTMNLYGFLTLFCGYVGLMSIKHNISAARIY